MDKQFTKLKNLATQILLKLGVYSGAPEGYAVPAPLSCYKPADKSWMKKGPEGVNDKWNISMLLCDTNVP